MGKGLWMALKYMEFIFDCAHPAVGWFPKLTFPE